MPVGGSQEFWGSRPWATSILAAMRHFDAARLVDDGGDLMYALHGRNTTACALAYTQVFGWKVLPGHRFRQQAGCTCQQPDCTVPGAHPLDEERLEPLEAGQITGTFDQLPGAGLIALCEGFDALTMPYQLGLALLLEAERTGLQAPCLTTLGRTTTLLVAPDTAQHLADLDPALTAARRWVALPPTRNVRWDSPPNPECPLLDAADLIPCFRSAAGSADAR